MIDTAVAPDASEVPWINPRLRSRRAAQASMTGIPGKTGLVYTLDRATGEFLWARPTIMQNVISASTAQRVPSRSAPTRCSRDPTRAARFARRRTAAKTGPPGAYSPRTKDDVLRDAEHLRLDDLGRAASNTRDALRDQHRERHRARRRGKVGTLRAISVETGKTSWRYDQRAALMALLATGGDLVFGGDVAGTLRAFDAETGKVLWETNLGALVTGHPVTFAVDGKQYVAVSTGRSNMTGGLSRLTPDVVPADSANKLFVFALPN